MTAEWQPWVSGVDPGPPPSTPVDVVRYVHSDAGQWPPMCYETVTTEHGMFRLHDHHGWTPVGLVDRFEVMPPRPLGTSTIWWRLR